MKRQQYAMIAAMILCAMGAMPAAHQINTEPIPALNTASTGGRSINTEPIPVKGGIGGASNHAKRQQRRSFSPSSIQPKPNLSFPGLEWKKAGQAGGQRKP